MKKIIILTACSFMCFSAFADIPRPPKPRVIETKITGADATELNKSLKGKTVKGSEFRTGYSYFNLFRSKSNLTQIVCETTVMMDRQEERTTECTYTQSLDLQPLPEFKPVIRMG